MTITMTRTLAPEGPTSATSLARTMATFRQVGRMDMSFGGRVLPGGTALEISSLCGARTHALANLVVRAGAGLGGKALQLGKPVSVVSYPVAQGITHVYDKAVGAEHLETVVALPVVVDAVPRLVVYLGNRTQVGLGDRWLDTFTPYLRRLERDVAVDDEVRRRLDAMVTPQPEEPRLSRAVLHDIADELAYLAERVTDDDMRARLERMRQLVLPAAGSAPATPRADVQLAPRELDVLRRIALGRTNAEAADDLGLLTNTVKSYLKSAMRKLGSTNRVQVIIAAREAGLIG